MENYTFEDMWLDLKNGYQIYYTYVRNRYVLFKTAKNCYTQKLISDNPKNPQPRMTMLTLKSCPCKSKCRARAVYLLSFTIILHELLSVNIF